MIPREVTYTFKRAYFISFCCGPSRRAPGLMEGELEISDLDNDCQRSKIKYNKWVNEETYKEINKLRSFVHPEEPGKKPPPVVTVEVGIEFDRTLRLIKAEKIDSQGNLF